MDITEIKDIKLIADQLQEEHAVTYDKEFDIDIDGFGDMEINRYWPELTRTDEYTVSSFKTFFQYFTSVKNYNSDPTKRCRYVDDPMVNGQVQKGRFRQVTTRFLYNSDGDLRNAIQKLRLGYETSVANAAGTDVDWTKARLPESNKAHGTEEYFTILFPNIASDCVDAVTSFLDDLAVSGFSPVINGETLGTGLHRLVTISRQQDDASHLITMILADPEVSYEGYKNYNTWQQEDLTYHDNVPKELQAGIIEAWKGTGRSAVSKYNTQTKLFDIVCSKNADATEELLSKVTFRNCDRYKTTSYYWGITLTSLNAIFAAIPEASTTTNRGKTYTVENLQNHGDGSYSLVYSIWTRNKRDYGTRRIQTYIGSETTRNEILGSISDDDIPSITTASRGERKTQRISHKDDCSQDIRTDTVTAKGITFAKKRVQNTGLIVTDETTKTGITADSSVTDISGTTAVGQAKLLRLSHNPNTGTINETLIEEQEQPTVVVEDKIVEDSDGQEVEETSKLHQTTLPTITTPSISERIVLQLSMTKNKAYNWVKRTFISKEQTIANLIAQERADVTRTITKQQQARTAPSNVTSEVGKIKSLLGIGKNPDGTFEYTSETQTGKLQTSNEYISSALKTIVRSISTNASADASSPTGITDGVSKSSSARSNPFGLYDKSETTETTTKRQYSRKSFSTRYGTAYFTICKYGTEADLDATLAQFTTSRQNSINGQIDDNGTISFAAFEYPYNGSGSATFYTTTKFKLSSIVPARTAEGVSTYFRDESQIHIKYHATKRQAYDEIDQNLAGSSVRQVTGELWESYKVSGERRYNAANTIVWTYGSFE